MKIGLKNLEKSQVEMEVEISPGEFQEFIDRAVFKLGENIEMKGFRKGRVPKEIIKEKIGTESLLTEAANLAVRSTYQRAVKEKNLEVISRPEVNILKMAEGNPFVYKAKFLVLPQVELPDYKKIASDVRKKEVEVKDQELENVLKWLQKSRSKMSVKLGPAQKGDFIEIEYNSSQLEKPETDAFILGQGQFLPGFEKVLFGLKAGEEKKEVPVSFPENHYRKELAGKEIKVNLKVNSVKKVEIPELTDDFARSLGRFKSLQDLKDSIKSGLKAEKEQVELQRIRAEVLEKIAAKVKVEVPKVLIEKEQERMLEDLKTQIQQRMGLKFEDYLKRIYSAKRSKTSAEQFNGTEKLEEDLKKSFLSQAEKRVKEYLVLRSIGEKENIEVSEKEVEERANQILRQHQNKNWVQKDSDSSSLAEGSRVDPEKLKAYTKEIIRTEKVFAVLESFMQH